jgi:hypothetical protein
VEGFSYETELVDHMSGPAGKEAHALEGLASAAEKTERSIHKLGEAHEEAGHSFLAAKEFGKDFSSSLVPEIALGELAAEGLKKIAESALEVGEKFVELGVEGVKFAVEMAEFKENAIAAYSAVQGTAEEGERTFALIDELGRNVHMPVERAHDMAQSLLELGMENMQEIDNAITAVSDLSRTGNEKGAAKLESIIERSLATGTFQVKGKELAAAKIQLPALLEELARETGKPLNQVGAELKAGKIGAEQGIVALENVFANSKIHQIAAQKFTLTDMLVDVKNTVKGIFQDVDSHPLMDALHDMAWAFGESGKEGGTLKELVTDTFNWIIKHTAPVIDAITELGQEFEIGYLKGRIAAKPLVEELTKITAHVGGFDLLSKAVASFAQWVTESAIGAALLVAKLWELKEAGDKIANSFVGGLVKGITGGKGAVGDAASDVSDYAVQRSRDTLGIQSPSRVMHEIGENVSRGLALGITSGSGDVARAMGDSIDVGSAGSVANDNGGGRSVVVHPGAIHVQVNAPQAAATADEIRELTESAMEDALERFVLEMGG